MTVVKICIKFRESHRLTLSAKGERAERHVCGKKSDLQFCGMQSRKETCTTGYVEMLLQLPGKSSGIGFCCSAVCVSRVMLLTAEWLNSTSKV